MSIYTTGGQPVTLYTTGGQIVTLYTTGGQPVTGGEPAPLMIPRQVMDKCYPLTRWMPAGHTSALSRKRHTVFRDAPDLRLAFNNMSITDPGQAAYDVKVAIEHDNGTIMPLTFNGAESGTVAPGGMTFTDPIELAAGEYWVRTRIEGDAETPLRAYEHGGGAFAPGEGTVFDVDTTYQAGPVGSDTSSAVGPCSATATVAAPSLGIVGDSISVGNGASGRGSYDTAPSALGIPTVIWGIGGRNASQFTDAVLDMLAPPAMTVDAIIIEHGVNSASVGPAGIRSHAAGLWARLKERWPRTALYQATINPYTRSTDGWATPENQTEVYPGVQGQYNTWIRDGAPLIDGTPQPGVEHAVRAGSPGHPLAGWVEVGGSVESGTGSNLWRPGPVTGDGLHPNDAGFALMAEPISGWVQSALL